MNTEIRRSPFDPCSHRETWDHLWHEDPENLRPLFAHFDVLELGQDALFRSLSVQGDRDRWRYAKANDYSTLRAQGNQGRGGHAATVIPSSPAVTGQPGRTLRNEAALAFQPCAQGKPRPRS